MGMIRKPENVCLICAICYNSIEIYNAAVSKLISEFGEIAAFSNAFSFRHTEYYLKEMGDQLEKRFMAFKSLIKPDLLSAIKHKTNNIENEFKIQNRRKVNIDPGYIEAPKLVLATTKNFSHRIYLQDGIYGDIELFWRDGKFNTYSWTYPDYKEDIALSFFTDIRSNYIDSLKKG